MGVIGFSFSGFSCGKEKVKNNTNPKIRINHNLKIENLKELDIPSFKKGEVVKIDFSFNIKYVGEKDSEKFGEIKLLGDVVINEKKELVKSLVSTWKKDKKIVPEINTKLINFIISKTMIRALDFADMLSLPLPFPVPKIKPNN